MIHQLQQVALPQGPGVQVASPAEDVLSLFVSDLPFYAMEEDLRGVFHNPMEHLPGDALGKVYICPFNVTDIRLVSSVGGTSKYAFVRFPSIAERTRALYIMQGVLCMGRPIRLSRAHAKDRTRENSNLVLFTNQRTREDRQRDNIVIDTFNSQWAAVDPKNTKVFVGGISPRIDTTDVVSRFTRFGTLTNVNFGKGCAFISFARKFEAEQAIIALNGLVMDGKPLRITWSRSSVQPLLQQQRTLVTQLPDAVPLPFISPHTIVVTPSGISPRTSVVAPTPPSSESRSSSPEMRFDSKHSSHSPSSPRSPITPITPFGNGAFPQFTPMSEKKSGNRLLRSGSLASTSSVAFEVPSLPHDKVEGSHSHVLDLAPGMARRQTVANIVHELSAAPMVANDVRRGSNAI